MDPATLQTVCCTQRFGLDHQAFQQSKKPQGTEKKTVFNNMHHNEFADALVTTF